MGTQSSKSEDNILVSKHGLDPSTMSSYKGMKSESSSSSNSNMKKKKKSFSNSSEDTIKEQAQKITR